MVFGFSRAASILPTLPRRLSQRSQSQDDRTPEDGSAPARRSTASTAAPMPSKFRCRGCNGVILFPASTEKRTCVACGTTTHLSEALAEEGTDEEEGGGEQKKEAKEEKVPQEGNVLYLSEDMTDPGEESSFRPRRRRQEHEDVDYLEVLAQLLQLALAACNADLLDCVAVVRNFQPSEHAALRCLAGKVCHELAVLNGEDDDQVCQKDSRGSSSSLAKARTRAEQVVAAFVAERLQTDKFDKNWGKSRRNSLASSFFDPRIDPTGSMNSRVLKRSGTSNTEISLTSYSDFAKDNRTFSLQPDASQADSSTPRGPAMGGKSRRASCASSKPIFSKKGSMASMTSAKTSMSRTTQISTMIRSLLRGQADKSKSENIGDLTWGMDGSPQGEGDQHVQQTKALISRYGGERRPQRPGAKGSVPAPGDDVPEISLNKGSLMTFVVRGTQLGAIEQDLRSSHGGAGSYEESVTTSVLLDHALAGMDLGCAHPRQQRQEGFSGFPGGSWMKRGTSGEPVVFPAEHELGGGADGHRQRLVRPGALSGAFSNPSRDHLCLIEEGSAASSSKASKASEKKEAAEHCCSPVAEDTEEAEEGQLTAKEKWLRRKEAKKKKRSDNGRTTYGAIIRNGYEQFLAAERGDAAAAPEAPAEPDAGGPGLRALDAAVERTRGAEQPGAAAHPPAGAPGAAEAPSKEEARARWEQRRVEKRAARKASSKTTYGQLVRLEHEQMLSTEAAASAPSADAARPAAKSRVLSSVRFRTHDGSLNSSPSSSTTGEGISAARLALKDPAAPPARVVHVDADQDLPGILFLGAQRPRKQSPGDAGTQSHGCHSILKDKPAHVEEGRRQRPPARSVEFNLMRNHVYDLPDS